MGNRGTALIAVLALSLLLVSPRRAGAGEVPSLSGYKVLAPIRQQNLTIFPVIASSTHRTEQFLTLDEGLRSGEVVVSEAGRILPLLRRPPRAPLPHPLDRAEVNKLVLVNNSKRPLLLLAGEIVTGGKQDRVIGKDRLVPPESDPIDLGVFCVEPGRWVQTSSTFLPLQGQMAAPAVRGSALAYKDQGQVWSEVRKAQAEIAAQMSPTSPEAVEIKSTSSYARVMENEEVGKRVDSVAAPIAARYSSLMHELRDKNAVGVVVAVNGEIIWADIFASIDLLEKYWPKLVRSYAAEAIVTRAPTKQVNENSAQLFLETMAGTHETVESEPGLYRHTEITGAGFKVFELTALLPKTGFDLHLAKMAE